MSTLTYDTASATAAAPTRKPNRKGFWARALDRLIEARVRQAHEHLARHQALLDDLRRHTSA